MPDRTLHDVALEAAMSGVNRAVDGMPETSRLHAMLPLRSQRRAIAAEAVAAYLAALAAHGWRLTPRERTGEMVRAWATTSMDEDEEWAAQHDAAPKPEDTNA